MYTTDLKENAEISSVYNSAKDDSTRASNFSLSKTSMFLNKNGELNIIAKFTMIAGAGYNYKPVNIENIKRNSKPLFEGAIVAENSTTPVINSDLNKTSETSNETINSIMNTVENDNTNTSNLVVPGNTTNTTNTINP